MFTSTKNHHLRLCLALGSALIAACGGAPSSATKKGLAENIQRSIDRKDFFSDKDNTDTESADAIKKDPKVKELSKSIAINPFFGCGTDTLAAGDDLEVAPVKLLNQNTKIESPRATILGKAETQIGGKGDQFQIANLFKIVSASPNNALGVANDMALKFSTTNSITSISQVEIQSALGATAKQPICGFIMATEQKALAADNKTFVNARFSKAIPQIINPILSPERIKLQLVEPIVISDITATLQTNDEDIQDTGLVQTGTVSIAIIPNRRTIIDSVGMTINIKSDVAYRITSQFTGPGLDEGETSVLDRVMEFYITGNQITNMVVKAPRPELPLIIYAK